MWAGDAASRALGMELVEVAPGRATLRMTVREDMVNGHAIGHGGFTFTLADSAFAFACNSYNRSTVAAGAEISVPRPDPARGRAGRRGGRAQPRGTRRRLRRHGAVRGHRGRASSSGRSKEIRGTLFSPEPTEED